MKPIRLTITEDPNRFLNRTHVFEVTMNDLGEAQIRNVRHESGSDRDNSKSIEVGGEEGRGLAIELNVEVGHG